MGNKLHHGRYTHGLPLTNTANCIHVAPIRPLANRHDSLRRGHQQQGL